MRKICKRWLEICVWLYSWFGSDLEFSLWPFLHSRAFLLYVYGRYSVVYAETRERPCLQGGRKAKLYAIVGKGQNRSISWCSVRVQRWDMYLRMRQAIRKGFSKQVSLELSQEGQIGAFQLDGVSRQRALLVRRPRRASVFGNIGAFTQQVFTEPLYV